MKRGKLLVISGPDGTGKTIQTGLLRERLERFGYKTQAIDFPQYENNFFGRVVGQYLRGEFGEADNVDPHLASVIYACDRLESSPLINNMLDNGFVVVANRYASDNQMHQGGKILNPIKRKEFLEWLEEMEFRVFKIPKPDVLIYLDVPLKISLELLKNKESKERKNYLSGGKDGHENKGHLERAKRNAAELIKGKNNWIKIDCAPEGKLLPPEQISDKIWKEVQPFLKILS